MQTSIGVRRLVMVMALALLATQVFVPAAGAAVTRTSGIGQHFSAGWTEYDPDDLLRLPGNTHVGFLAGWDDQYGGYFFGIVSDYDCDPGEVPGGGGHGVAEAIVEEGVTSAEAAVAEAIDNVIDSGATNIDAALVVEAVQSELAAEMPAAIEDEVPACDFIQDRFLNASASTAFSVDTAAKVATVTGTLVVTGGDHGGGPVLGEPPVNMTITGGEEQHFDYSFKSWGQNFRFSESQRGTNYWGGTVTGAIGAMGFADDPDDESHGGFGSYKYKTVERIRN